jgi:formylmethanofuran dehydrogenase subunit D
MTYIDKPVVPNVDKYNEPLATKRDKLDLILNTGSDIYQGACKKRGSTLKDEYRYASGTAYLDPHDMARLDFKNWDTGLLKTDWGEVVVFVAHSRDAPHEGQVFMAKGPWVNTVVSPDTYCSCDPTYKGIPATIEKCDEEPLLMADLMAEVYMKYDKNAKKSVNHLTDKKINVGVTKPE